MMMIMLLPMMIMMTMICHHNDDNLHFKCATMRHVKTQRQQQSRQSQDDDGVRWRRRWHLFLAIWIYPPAHRIYLPAFCIWHNVLRNLQSPYLAMAQKIACFTPSLPPCLPVTQQICHTKLVFVTNRVGSDRDRERRRGRRVDWLKSCLACKWQVIELLYFAYKEAFQLCLSLPFSLPLTGG